jgi:hypothetical protein
MGFYRFVSGNDEATDEPMDGVALVYFKGLWRLYGGWNGFVVPPNRNSQYTSPDLITWTKASDAEWNPSHSFGLVHDTDEDVLYKIGSDAVVDTTATDRKQIWKTIDGENWTLVGTHDFLENVILFFSGYAEGAIYIGGGHVLSGGVQSAGSVNTKVWKSIDGGENFTEIATGITEIGGNIGNQCKWYPDIQKWVLVCGPSKLDPLGANRTYVKTCYLADLDWTEVTPDADFPGVGRQYADMTYHDGKMWLINGSVFNNADGANSAELWYRNKWDWARINDVPLTTTHATGIASNGETLAIMCGNMNQHAYYLEENSTDI